MVALGSVGLWVAVVVGGGRRRSWVLHLLPMSLWNRILAVLACL